MRSGALGTWEAETSVKGFGVWKGHQGEPFCVIACLFMLCLDLCGNLGAHDDGWRNGNGGNRESGHKGSRGEHCLNKLMGDIGALLKGPVYSFSPLLSNRGTLPLNPILL